MNRNKYIKAIWQSAAIISLAALIAFLTNQYRSDRLSLTQYRDNKDNFAISLAQASALFLNKTAVFLDARPTGDFMKGHIKGAKNLPYKDVDRLFDSVLADISPDTPVITYCDGETCELGHELALFLKDMGFNNVKTLVNGWAIWKKAKLPAESKH